MHTGTVFIHLSLSSTNPGAYDRLFITSHYSIMDHEGGELVPYRMESNKPFYLVPMWDFQTNVYR